MKQILFLVPLSILSLWACQKKIATAQLPETQLVFGNGGGFAGTEYTYALLEDGRILAVQKNAAEQKIVSRIGKAKAKTQFAASDSMRLATRLYDKPGNIYHFIVVKKAAKKENRIVWDASKPIPDLEQFYQTLNNFLPKTAQ
jgi:hypothetical protein